MSLNNILNSGNPSPDWVNLRSYSITNDSTITTTDINITGALNVDSLTIDDLTVNNNAILPPIEFNGSSTNFSFDSVTFNVTFTMYDSLNVSQGTENTTIRYTKIGNLYCLVLKIFTITAIGDYQYLECLNPGIQLPSDFCYCPIMTLDNNINYNGFVTISPSGSIKIFKNANQDNFGAITAFIPYSTCFYSII